MVDGPLPAVDRRHLETMTGALGIWQHARGASPDRAFGYCTDDVARALVVDVLHARELGWERVSPSARRSLRFLERAWNPTRARFRNMRDASGVWLDHEGSEDTEGRALLALGTALGEPRVPALASDVRRLFSAALPGAARLRAVRPIAMTILACGSALDGSLLGAALRGTTTDMLGLLTRRLRDAFPADAMDAGWPWPEGIVTYENALLPHALLVGGRGTGDAGVERLGFRVLGWLADAQRSPGGWLSPVGNRGWWPRGQQAARYDQQPIEASAHLLACATALAQSSDARWAVEAERAYGWFLGENDGRARLADAETGGCHDGLGADGVNRNQGAESTLMWLMALERLRRVRRASVGVGRSPELASTVVVAAVAAQ